MSRIWHQSRAQCKCNIPCLSLQPKLNWEVFDLYLIWRQGFYTKLLLNKTLQKQSRENLSSYGQRKPYDGWNKWNLSESRVDLHLGLEDRQLWQNMTAVCCKVDKVVCWTHGAKAVSVYHCNIFYFTTQKTKRMFSSSRSQLHASLINLMLAFSLGSSHF